MIRTWPLASASLGAWQYSIFGSMMIVAATFIFFCTPETKGRSTEEMTELFADPSHPFHGKQDIDAILGRTPDSVGDKFDIKRVATADSIAYRAGTIKRVT